MARAHNMRKNSVHFKLHERLDANARFGLAARGTVVEEDSAGNNYRNTDRRVLPMHIEEASDNAASTHPSWLQTIRRHLRKPGTYVSLGLLLLPGGSLLVLLLWLFSRRAKPSRPALPDAFLFSRSKVVVQPSRPMAGPLE
jgi:hypothetical protein